MKTGMTISLICILIGLTGSFLQQGPTPQRLPVPKGWPAPGNIFRYNPLTKEGFILGRTLFYDGRLSKDGSIPCAGCHQPFAAFATLDHDFSHGFNNSLTKRNAPALFNLAWMQEMHWDGAAAHLEIQPISPLTHPDEMAEKVDSVLVKLRADTAYHRLFRAAFGTPAITEGRMLKALAQFTGSIVSCNSKYDRVKAGKAIFTQSELQGYQVFRAKCGVCHREPLFTDNRFRNNGLTIDPRLRDPGRMGVTGKRADSLKFKVPSLRNLYLTYPYMHDGRMLTLQQVLEHYRNGIDTSQSTLDPLLKKRLKISPREEVDLLAFLFTLTDATLAEDSRFAEPVVPLIHEGPHHRQASGLPLYQRMMNQQKDMNAGNPR